MTSEDKTNETPDQDDTEGHRFVGQSEGSEPPSRFLATDDDDDVEGHTRILHSDEGGSDDLGHSARRSVGAIDDDVEGHVKVGHSSDPDFAAKAPGRVVGAKDDDDVEGHLKER